MKALLTSLTRSSDAGLVPMYLLFNHNNALINTRLTYTEEGVLVKIRLDEKIDIFLRITLTLACCLPQLTNN